MAVGVLEPIHVELGTSETTIIDEVASGLKWRVTLYIHNYRTNTNATFQLNRYDADASETQNNNNTFFFKDKPIDSASAETFVISFYLSGGWKLTGQANTGTGVVVQVDRVAS